MLRIFLFSLAIAAVAASAAAQNTAPATAVSESAGPATGQASLEGQMPAGTVIVAELSKSLDAKKVKPGDKIEAKTSMDLLSQGKVVIPRDTKIVGHVIEAKAHSKDSPDSMLGIAFDRMLLKEGRELPMQAAIQAMARPLQNPAFQGSGPMSDNGGMPSSAPMPGGGGMSGGGARSSTPSTYPTSAGADAPASGGPAPLGPASKGVVGMKGLELKSAGPASVITSEKDNVHLDSGTQLILRTQ